MPLSKTNLLSSKDDLLSSKDENDILLISHVPSLCFLLWNLFILCLIIFLLNRVSLNFLDSVAIFTPFAVLNSLPSIFLLSTSLTLIRQIHQLHFLQTSLSFCQELFHWSHQKTWIFQIVTIVKQMFALKKFFINIFWFYFMRKTVYVSKKQFSIKKIFNKVAMKAAH